MKNSKFLWSEKKKNKHIVIDQSNQSMKRKLFTSIHSSSRCTRNTIIFPIMICCWFHAFTSKTSSFVFRSFTVSIPNQQKFPLTIPTNIHCIYSKRQRRKRKWTFRITSGTLSTTSLPVSAKSEFSKKFWSKPGIIQRCQFHQNYNSILKQRRPSNNNQRWLTLLSSSSTKTSIPDFLSTSTRSKTTPRRIEVEVGKDDDNRVYDNDTIFALSSGGMNDGQATAVAIIRITGTHSRTVLENLLLMHRDNKENSTSNTIETSSTQQRKSLTAVPRPRYAGLRKLYNWKTGDVLDQAVVLYFPGPNSYTGEDIVELHCHGSRAVITQVLETLQQPFDVVKTDTNTDKKYYSFCCCRLAEPGEFTQRAWKNGKLDVLQLEALADLLTADTNQQLQQAMRQLDGQLSAVYETWRKELIAALAHAEAVIDFGDDEVLIEYNNNDDDDDNVDDDNGNQQQQQQQQQETIWGGIVDKMRTLQDNMQIHLRDSRRGELVRQGVQIAIIGPPNAGKSSLFNLLANRDAAIVSPHAGTTRDVLEVTLNLGGVKCIVQDTAGVREHTTDMIEQEGMKRALRVASQADLVVAMVDCSSTEDTKSGLQILQKVLEEQSAATTTTTTTTSSTAENLTPSRDMRIVDRYNISLNPKNTMLVLNKADLANSDNNHWDSGAVSIKDSLQTKEANLLDAIGGYHFVSCVSQHGIDKFLDDLTNRVAARIGIGGSGIENNNNNNSGKDNSISGVEEGSVLITRTRHRQHIQAAVEALKRFHSLSSSKRHGDTVATVDIAAEELRLAASEIGRITGAVDVEDVLDKLFADFCIGK